VGLLLDGRFLPTTGVIGFVERPLTDVTDAFCAVVAAQLETGPAALRREPVEGPLASALERLRPLAPTPAGDRFLLCPTDGAWTAYFDNASTGGDPRPVAAALPDLLGCRSLIVLAAPDPGARNEDPPRMRTIGFSLAAPGHAGWTDAVRVLIVSHPGGQTEVQTYGDPLPVEDTGPRDLDIDTLDSYLRFLGVKAFCAAAYLPEGSTGLLITGPPQTRP
jgi:hypothetical protein